MILRLKTRESRSPPGPPSPWILLFPSSLPSPSFQPRPQSGAFMRSHLGASAAAPASHHASSTEHRAKELADAEQKRPHRTPQKGCRTRSRAAPHAPAAQRPRAGRTTPASASGPHKMSAGQPVGASKRADEAQRRDGATRLTLTSASKVSRTVKGKAGLYASPP